MTAYINLLKKLSADTFLNKLVLLATTTSVLARIELILASTGTGIKSLNLARILTGMEFRYISKQNTYKKKTNKQKKGKVNKITYFF